MILEGTTGIIPESDAEIQYRYTAPPVARFIVTYPVWEQVWQFEKVGDLFDLPETEEGDEAHDLSAPCPMSIRVR